MSDLMLDIKNNHRRFIAEFIKLYKSFPTLWKLKSPEYNDRDNKREAYTTLVQKLQEVEPDCTKQDVIKKINSLRSAFRREYRKVKQMRACGKLYNPTLWYYDLLTFTITNSRPKFKRAREVEKVGNATPVPSSMMQSIKEEDIEDPLVDDYLSFEGEENNFVATEECSINSYNNFQDEFDAIGYNVASKLRHMPKEQKIIAERVIAETLFQGQMGLLSVTTTPSNFLPSVLCNVALKHGSALPL